MVVASRPRTRSWLALLLGALLLLTVAPRWAAPAAEAATPGTSAAHPFGDPVWFPLRHTAKVGCAKSGCGTRADHGYFAIDFIAEQDDPVYAAGAGIAHIGANSGSCSTSATKESEGRWVWIDHGAGVVSRYHHLNSIAITDGQLVTPQTRIGGMGHSGDFEPCTTNYLHFEVRNGGLKGDRVDFGSLKGCRDGGVVNLPEVFGFSSWNDPGLHPTKRLWTPVLSNDCMGSSWLDTPDEPQVSAARTAKGISVSRAGTAGTWVAFLEVYRPSIKTWRPVEYRTSSASTASATFTDLEQRRYRVAVAVHGSGGWSAWSPTREVTAVPGAPKAPRYLKWKRKTSTSKSYLHYGWYRPDSFGSDVSSFVVARRCGRSASSLGAWKEYRQSKKNTYRNVRKLTSAQSCEIKVRAVNAAGAGPWSKTSSIHR